MSERRTIAHLGVSAGERFGPRTMIHRKVGGAWITHTFGEVAAMRRGIAAGLHGLGVQKGDRVAIVSSTRFEWALTDNGALAAGAVVVGVYPTLTPDQMAYIIGHAGCRVVVVEDKALLDKLRGVRAAMPSVERFVVFDGVPTAGDVTAYADLLAAGRAADEQDPALCARLRDAIDEQDTATLVYTSGTTGPPKGVVLTHGALFGTSAKQAEVADLTPEDVGAVFLPMAHVLGRVAGYSAAHIGVELWFAESMEKAPELWTLARPTTMALVPRVFEKIHAKIVGGVQQSSPLKQAIFRRALDVGTRVSRLAQRGQKPSGALALEHALFERIVYSKIRTRIFGGRVTRIFCGSAPLGLELLEFFHAIGLLILEGYGLTETCSPTTMNRANAYKFGTVGRPIAGVEVQLADDGEIKVKSPGLFTGYFQDDEATRAVFDDEGWFLTGDIGELDQDGYLRITDRKKDLIITAGGKNVAPQNIEARLRREAPIGQAVLFGDKKPYLVALVTIDPERAAGAGRPEVEQAVAGAIARVNGELARYESIKKWHILDEDLTVDNELLTPSLKVRRRAVLARYGDVVERLYAS